jgi:O-antigen/teichoic acid export membrane protein
VYARLSELQLARRFFSNAGLYAVSILVTRAGWLVLLPIYWTRLTPADFGIIGIAQLVQSVLTPVLGLGLVDAAQRLYLEWPERERGRHLFTLLLAAALAGAIICFALEIAGAALFGLLFEQVAYEPYIRLAVWTAFCANIALIPLALLRLQERILAFSVITLGAFAIQAAVGIYLVVVRDAGPFGYLLAALAAAAASGVGALLVLAPQMKPGWSFRELRASLRYGLPTALVFVIESLSTGVDRFFLDKHVALGQIGLYNLANQFGAGFNVFNQALKTSWVPFLYRAAAERSDTPQVLGRLAVLYLAVLAIPALAVALLAEDFIHFFGGERYRGVYPYVPFFVLYYYIWSMAAALGRGMDLAKRTEWWPLVPSVGLIVGASAAALLVPPMGVWGAVVSILLAVTARAVIQVVLSVRFYPRPLHLGRLAGIAAIALAGFALAHSLAPEHIIGSVLFKTVAVLACAPLLLWVGFRSRDAAR